MIAQKKSLLTALLALSITPLTVLAAASNSDNLSGFYMGVGGGTTYITTSSDLMNNINDVAMVDDFKSNTSNLLATAQIGYWANTSSKVLWGANLNYSYQNTSTDNQFFFAQNFGTMIGSTHVNATISAFAMVAVPVGNLHLYAGAGPTWAQGVKSTVSVYSSTPFDTDGASHISETKKDLFGAAVKAGLIYNLDANNFIDAGFSLGISEKKDFVHIDEDLDIYITKKIGITTGNASITFNHKFA